MHEWISFLCFPSKFLFRMSANKFALICQNNIMTSDYFCNLITSDLRHGFPVENSELSSEKQVQAPFFVCLNWLHVCFVF